MMRQHRIVVCYPEAHISEVLYLENLWRSQIGKVKRSRLRPIFSNILPVELIDKIADEPTWLIFANVTRAGNGTYMLEEKVFERV